MLPKSKKELANDYKIDSLTLCTWLKKIPNNFYETIKQVKILTPLQLKIIYDHLGEP